MFKLKNKPVIALNFHCSDPNTPGCNQQGTEFDIQDPVSFVSGGRGAALQINWAYYKIFHALFLLAVFRAQCALQF